MDHEWRAQRLKVIADKVGDFEVFTTLVLWHSRLEGYFRKGRHSIHLGLLELLRDKTITIAVDKIVFAL